RNRSTGRLRLTAFASMAALLATVQCAYAMQFARVPLEDNEVVIRARGPIIEGDFERLLAFASNLPASDRIIGFSLDSPGGRILEAEKIAGIIHRAGFPVLVSSGSECASACFLLLAAS